MVKTHDVFQNEQGQLAHIRRVYGDSEQSLVEFIYRGDSSLQYQKLDSFLKEFTWVDYFGWPIHEKVTWESQHLVQLYI